MYCRHFLRIQPIEWSTIFLSHHTLRMLNKTQRNQFNSRTSRIPSTTKNSVISATVFLIYSLQVAVIMLSSLAHTALGASSRRVLFRPSAAFAATASSLSTKRSSSSGSKPFNPIPVDLEHYTEGWNVKDVKEFTQSGFYAIQTFNKISPIGLARFPSNLYTVEPMESSTNPAHALLLRSHKLREEEIGVSVRAIARCGAGTNNIPVARCTQMGIPVFNTPGANANAVKELILCGMLLASRRIVDGINHMKDLGSQGLAKERVEKDKAKFGGRELKGKTLAVIGLGHIGAATARDARILGMNVQVRTFVSCRFCLALPPCLGLLIPPLQYRLDDWLTQLYSIIIGKNTHYCAGLRSRSQRSECAFSAP